MNIQKSLLTDAKKSRESSPQLAGMTAGQPANFNPQ